MLDQTTLRLFGKFPREVGAETTYGQKKSFRRGIVRNSRELQRFIELRDGVVDPFVGVQGDCGKIINELFFDIEKCTIFKLTEEGMCANFKPKNKNFNNNGGKNCDDCLNRKDGMTQMTLDNAKALYRYLLNLELNSTPIPVVSGKKGFHVHYPLKPEQYDQPKQLLMAVQLDITHKVFNKPLFETAMDPHCLVGNPRILCRIPNTLRPPDNNAYCTYLPPTEFLDMTMKDVLRHMKSPHSYDYGFNGNNLPTLDDFDVDYKKLKKIEYYKPKLSTTNNVRPRDVKKFLKAILRPCLFNRITTINPMHAVRLATTIDLLNRSYTPEEVTYFYSKLGWKDWDLEFTMLQVSGCQKYVPYGCKKLRILGVPLHGCCVG